MADSIYKDKNPRPINLHVKVDSYQLITLMVSDYQFRKIRLEEPLYNRQES